MNNIARLYTPELLGLAVRLADYPLGDDMPLIGEARSASCGSTLRIGIRLDAQDTIAAIGMRVHACAVGQAAAAIFADAAMGRMASDIAVAYQEMEHWLDGTGGLPNWPGIHSIEAAGAFPGRHGAIRLPWQAAQQALFNGAPRR